MFVCCTRKAKVNKVKTKSKKFLPRQYGDLSFVYDIMQAYEGNYMAQVSIENNHPLGRLDHWNLTWEWMRGEFINSMRGAYTHKIDATDCIYGAAGQFYQGLDFSNVMNCEKNPIIGDLPSEKAKDEKVGFIPNCCRNGTLLPTTMDKSKSKAAFQLQVYKIPPDLNRTALFPPEKWKIVGALNPEYKCGPPIRVDPTEFPDETGLLQVTSSAIASWQVSCNITQSSKKMRNSRCCVSYSAFYNDSVVPCNTCACGCESDDGQDSVSCNPNIPPLLLPSEALLVPFGNRTAKAKAWARLKHLDFPHPMPCPDNCGVSINWHINTDYRTGWTARITLFNWEQVNFEDWFVAVEMKKAFPGYENIYSFNGTVVKDINDTLFFQGLPGLNWLMGIVNGSDPKTDPKIPGKQQSVISFRKKLTPGIKIKHGDGFPSKLYFNGEECSLPAEIPTAHGIISSYPPPPVNLVSLILLTSLLIITNDHFH